MDIVCKKFYLLFVFFVFEYCFNWFYLLNRFEIGYNNSSIIFNINDADYLGKINSGDDNLENPYIRKPKNQIKSIKEKLLWHIKQHVSIIINLFGFRSFHK